jgi:hypothetical protein
MSWTVKGGTAVIWDFLQRYDESWIWRRTERHEVTESKRNFAALDECVADAALHGYTAPQRKGERTADSADAARERRRRKTSA